MNNLRTHTAVHPMQNTAHWLSMHLVHDYHFWLYLLVSVAVISFVALIVYLAKSAPMMDEMFMYPGYPYGIR